MHKHAHISGSVYRCLRCIHTVYINLLDCTNIMIHGWIQNLLVRRSNSPTDGSKNTVSSAQAEVLPSTTKAVTTFREDGEYVI